jgi:hypothetical protein
MSTVEVQSDLKQKESSNALAEVIYLFESDHGESWPQETQRLYDEILPICREPELVVPAAIPADLCNQEMMLEICEFPDYFVRRGNDGQNAEAIAQQLQTLSWNEVNLVTLRLDRANWMEASGSEPGGFSVLCCVDGNEYVTHAAPASLAVLIELLQSYAARDDAWRTSISWCD